MARAIAALAALALAGCAVAPDTLCQLQRPAWHINDTELTIVAQQAAADLWDRHCTVAGLWRR